MEESSQKTFLEAYDHYADALYRHAYFRLSEKARAEELVQEAFMKSWEYCASHGGNIPENLRAFLYRVLNNLIIDEFRKKKSVSLDLLMDEGYEPSEETEEKDIIELGMVKDLLGALEPKYRDLLILRYIDELSVTEIAAITNDRENTISVRLHRAVAKLKEAYIKQQKKI